MTLLEHLFELWRDSESLSKALARLAAGEDLAQRVAFNLSVLVSFLVYHVAAEIERAMGPGALRRLFFGRAGAESRGGAA